MKRNKISLLAVAMVLLCFVGALSSLSGEPQATKQAVELPLVPQQPGGYFGEILGTLQTIEGVMDERHVRIVPSNSLLVDTVNGKKLTRPIPIEVRNAKLPAKARCVLKGYELGEMNGQAPAVDELEFGKGAQPLRQLVWHWRPYFVTLAVVEPADLKLTVPRDVEKR
ncbi:MAG: hypothetical protein SGJ20_07700 [Planctomycetota bacterium]|nr:hypothetical protein [Planctomycetota bacterium]